MGDTQQQAVPAQQPVQPVQPGAPGASGAPGAPATTPVESRGWFIAKIVLGSAALVFSIISVGLAAGTWPWGTELLWTVPIAGLSICWLVAEFITLCARRHRKGIHPGAHVGMHLVIWLGFVACLVLNSFMAYYISLYGYYDDDDDYYSYYYGSTSISRSMHTAMIHALLAFSLLLLIIHFILFVRACVETNTRNKTSRNVQYIYVQQPVYYTPQGMQGQPPMGYAAPQQPPQQMAPGMQPAHYSGQWNGYYAPPQQQQQQMHGNVTKDVQGHPTGQSVPSSFSASQNGNAHGVEQPAATHAA